MDQTQETQKLLMQIAQRIPVEEIGGVMIQLREIQRSLNTGVWLLLAIAAIAGTLLWRLW